MDTAPPPEPIQRMLTATNTEDSPGFLDAFSDDAVVDDWGRKFIGTSQIASWNAAENIGTHNRIEVTDVRHLDNGVELAIEVSGEGYNGSGTFVIEVENDKIRSMLIRG